MDQEDPLVTWRQWLEDMGYRVGRRLADLWTRVRRSELLPAIGVGALVLLVGKGVEAMREKKVFVSFAVEDKWARERLRGQALNTRTPFKYRDMGLDEPFSDKWKTQCRDVIKDCDGVIALLSKNTARADGARWEMKCAVDEGVPIVGVHSDKTNKGPIPAELRGQKVIEWKWDELTSFIDSL